LVAELEELKAKTRVAGLVVGELVTVLAVEQHGTDTVEVTYRTADGALGNRLLGRADEDRLSIQAADRPWPLTADGAAFRLASEAKRIQLAHLFDPYLAVDTSTIDPLPHQIEAVYQEMLPRSPLRFLLADDPGAGKTIMSGLYIRELMIRGDLDRCLIVAPGSLVEQWQEELDRRFDLPFDILSRDMVESARTGNPFTERPLLIARIDQLARNEDLQAKMAVADWDLVIFDEAHKLSAHYYGDELKKTKRFQIGELLRDKTRHLLLLTATPHNGKDEDFQQFMSLLDPDRFAGRLRHNQLGDVSDLMRRYVKERMLRFDGRPLFTERIATTANYDLSPLELILYEEVTEYVLDGMNRADRLQQGGDRRRGLAVGFALAALQRRLASSPEAIYRSLKRRRQRLEQRLAEAGPRVDNRVAEVDLPRGFSVADLDVASEDFDPDDLDDTEREALEDAVIGEATGAATLAELRLEVDRLNQLEELADQVRAAKTDRKWEELNGILQSDEMTAPDGTRRKLIVFTEHKDTLDYLVDRIRSVLGGAERVVAIHGGVRREDRRRIQQTFTSEPVAQVLVATDAAGEGVNLQRANLMVNYDLPWNPNRIEQRFGRIHRIGQTETCFLWNLVAHQTREGKVFERLFEKIEQQGQALGGQVYDVLGDAEINRSLQTLLIEAIRYGDRPEVRERMERVIDEEIGTRLVSVLEERSLASNLLDATEIESLRQDMERALARKLQPSFIREFFLAAFRQFGGRISERESGRFEIARVPAMLRSRDREIGVGAPIATAYERVTFDKDRTMVPGKPPADLLAPGHPLLAALIDTVLEHHGATLSEGTVFVDPDDPTETAKALLYLEHTVADARGGGRPVSSRFQFVEIGPDGSAADAGDGPYLLYRPATDAERGLLADVVGADWISTALNDTARSYAVANLAGPHFTRVRAIIQARVARVRRAVEERLKAEILYWDGRAAELKQKELQGKKGRLNSGRARQRADDLESRLERRTRELDQELDLSNLPPVVVGGALVVPQGLLDRLSGTRTEPMEAIVRDVEEVDRRAVAAVMAAERSIGRIPTEMAHTNPGYDIESLDPETGMLYFIEVKGRIEGQDTVTVKARQVRQAKNNPDRFRLVIAIVPRDETAEPAVHYLVRPFEDTELGFAAVSVTLALMDLLRRSGGPE